MPEVSLIAILDADKEGFLRSETSLIQTIGRAARNINGRIVMYADEITDSMQKAIDENDRRRSIQEAYNKEHNLTPATVSKSVRDIIQATHAADDTVPYEEEKMSLTEIRGVIINLESEMKEAAENLEFERAASLRDEWRRLMKEYGIEEQLG